jgi:L-ascorbate metabolism protein UlaG (beta-lactamase superfamily)
LTKSTLLAEIVAATPEQGVVVWWLGQSGFIIRGRAGTVAIDPFLTDFGHFGRLYEPPCSPADVDFLDLLLGTHAHADHIDPLGFPQLLEASREAFGVVPAAVLPRVASLVGSPARLVGASVDRPVERDGITVTAIPAVHADMPADGYGLHLDAAGEHPFVGYVIELDGVRLCHTGDTLVYDGLADRLRRSDLDLLMLPINGVSWFREQRGLVGNLNVFEAAELADVSGARLMLPMHWDLFADNTEDPEHLVRYAAAKHPAVNVQVPTIGVPLHLSPR